ncbi:MAG TPA: dolichyl-phosphate beta-glucosyltransferase [Candidatus Binatia bacterium]
MEPQAPAYLSLIIPAFNEDRRIGQSLERILSFFRAQSYPFEIIVVDDGSTDRTVEVVRGFAASDPQLRVEPQPQNRGKGEAIRKGMLLAGGKYLFFSDADLSVPIEAVPDFLSRLEAGDDVAVGSRRIAGAVIEVHQPIHRELMGKVFTGLSNLILGLKLKDFTCGFKAFRRDAARELFSRQRLGGWSFDSEILYLAKSKGYRIAEVPVVWRNDEATKVRLGRDVVRSFVDLWNIRINHALGKYR